ncbi:MAG: TolC family protein [Deltaproteobacteria bacterium]|nr:TolC family protein [Deltaproteobacteria bacterium]
MSTCLLAGCASIQRDTSWPEARPLGAGLEAYRPPRLPEARTVLGEVDEPTGVLSLRETQALALLNSPRLAAFSWDVRAHEARTLQAGLAPNPEFSFRMEDVGGTDDFHGVDSAETTIQFAQRLELGGKRARRHRVADLDEDVAGWDYETERVEVLTEVAQSFAVVLVAQERLELADELVRIAEESLATVAQEVEEGLASPIAGTRAKVALAAAQVDRDRTRAELATARSNLAAGWGSEQERFARVEGELEAVQEPPGLESLLVRMETNPDLARFATEVERRRAVVELEKSQRIQDVTVAAGVRRFSATTDTAVVFGFDVPIPLVNRNKGGVLAARYELAKAEEERRAARLRVLTNLAAADDRLQSAYREVTSLRRDVLPDAEEVHRQILEEFDAGNYAYDDVLDAQRTLFRLRGQYLKALESYHVSVAEVERLIGEPLHGAP